MCESMRVFVCAPHNIVLLASLMKWLFLLIVNDRVRDYSPGHLQN